MKPKTKFQKKIVALSKTVEPITKDQEQWAEKECFGGYYVRCRKRNYCLECGHKWKPHGSYLAARILKPTCPSCGAKNLKHVDNWDTHHSVYEYYAKIEVVDDFQLVRMFRVQKYMKRKQPAEYTHVEAMQHFIGEDGKSESLQRLGQGLGSIYIDSWVYGSHLELRTKSPSYYQRNSLAPYKIIPGRETLPIIRRNGYKGYFYKKAPNEFFEAILNHQKAETLLKAGQISLFKKYVGLQEESHERIDQYWDSICIAMRNEYIIKDAGDYLDYLSMLDEFEKDLRNPKYVCPTDFHREHQRYVEKRRVKRKAEAKAERRKQIKEAEAEYLKAKSKYFDFKVVSGDLQIETMKSVKDIIELGDKLHHCLGLNYARKKNSLIMGAFINGEPVEAIEINLKRLEIIQARGLQNRSTEYHDLIVKSVQQNMNKIAQRNKYSEVA